MSDGSMMPFVHRFGRLAERETRVATVGADHPSLPPGGYAFVECYCEDPDCDCRRVQVQVYRSDRVGPLLATLAYGWAPPEYYVTWMYGNEDARDMAGLMLEPMGRQTELAPALLDLFAEVLEDPRYVARLERHYDMVKKAVRRSAMHRRRLDIRRRRRR